MPVSTSSFMCGVLTSSSFCECLVHNNRAQSVTRFLQRSRDSGGRGPAGVGPAEIVSPVRTDVTETARKRFSPTLGAYSSMTICGFEPLYGGGDDDRSCSGAGTESTLRCFGRLHSSRQSTVSEDRLMLEIGSHT